MGKIAEETIGEYQAGFRSNKSTTDQIYVLKHLIANSYEHNLELDMLFIDFKQAYDTINKTEMIEILRELKIPTKLINLTTMTLDNTSCKVLVEGQVSESFRVERGLKQGDPVSPILFNLVLEGIIRRGGLFRTGVIYRQKHQLLAYADDIVIVTRTRNELRQVFQRLVTEAKRIGLRINETKTKFMRVAGQQMLEPNDLKIKVEDGKVYNFEEVNNFTYLGVSLASKNVEDTEIKTRLLKGSKCVGSLYKFLKF